MKTPLVPCVRSRIGRLRLAVLALSIPTSPAGAQDKAFERAKAILRATPILDTHNDLPWVIREKATPPRDVESFDLSKRAPFDTDIPRLREGMVGAQFWSVWVPSGLPPLDAMRTQLEQIDLARRM